MPIIYEINPPKISSQDSGILVQGLEEKVANIAPFCDGIHVTDSVLGTKRISAIYVAKRLKHKYPKHKITISLRVRDRDMAAVQRLAREAAEANLEGILILKGDPSKDNSSDSGLIPSKVVKELYKTDLKDKIKFFLSLPSNPDFNKIRKKIDARPEGFVTQVIHSAAQVIRICNELKPKGFKIIPCILIPSKKNERSAKFLGIDWSSYENNPAEFIRKIHSIAGDVLITSPNDSGFARRVLEEVYNTKYSASG